MSIQYFNEDIAFPKVKKRITSSWIKQVIFLEEKRVGDISFIFCSDEYLLDVNRKYLNHDYFTDIITFDDVEGDVINGDIFISVDRVKENSNEFATSFDDEVHRILIHGVLHLLGYKDKAKKDKNLMTEKEDFYLKLFNDSYLLTKNV
jgi:rRNA maturation RNase YbeY